MSNADADWIRSVFERLVGSGADILTRITFESGNIFVLNYLSEWEEDDVPEAERDRVGAWAGAIVGSENLSDWHAKLFRAGSGIVFAGSEIVRIEDELTREVLFSRAEPR